MRTYSILTLLIASCSSDVSPVPIDAPADVGAVDDLGATPDSAPEPEVDAPPALDCAQCVITCVMDNCPLQGLACVAAMCQPVASDMGVPDVGPSDMAAADSGGPDGGGPDLGVPDAGPPQSCFEIIGCIGLNGCNPLAGTGDPCVAACYGPACSVAQGAYDALLDCAATECGDDCAGCL